MLKLSYNCQAGQSLRLALLVFSLQIGTDKLEKLENDQAPNTVYNTTYQNSGSRNFKFGKRHIRR